MFSTQEYVGQKRCFWGCFLGFQKVFLQPPQTHEHTNHDKDRDGPTPPPPRKNVPRFPSNLHKTFVQQYRSIVVRAPLAETAVMVTISAASTVARFPWSKQLLKNYYLNIQLLSTIFRYNYSRIIKCARHFYKIKTLFPSPPHTACHRSAGPPPIPPAFHTHYTSILLLFYFYFTFISLHFTCISFSIHFNLFQYRFESISLPCPFHSTSIPLLNLDHGRISTDVESRPWSSHDDGLISTMV